MIIGIGEAPLDVVRQGHQAILEIVAVGLDGRPADLLGAAVAIVEKGGDRGSLGDTLELTKASITPVMRC